MKKRREFSKPVKVEIKKRCQVPTGWRCELCGVIVQKGEIDHIDADALALEEDKTRKLTAAEGRFLCKPCHKEKTKADVKIIAKVKRVEARHVGATRPKGALRSAGFPKKERREKLPLPPRRAIYEDVKEQGE